MSSPRADLMFRAFADETRLRILHLLSLRELCVCDIQAALRLPQSKVSRHLATLRRAGLVLDRKEGLWRHYRLARPEGRFQRGLFGCLGACFEEVDVLKRDSARLAATARRKAACR
ncbi:MAG: metalloregulator ArsR/SmtB family transcription factor [Elusimicrobia bacterium]|nr:metalloregulator ArsR/SmtB family transcription factor [Elusimicrobiota bacterium]